VGGGVGRQGVGQGFSHRVQLGEVIAARLDVFAHPFGRAVVVQGLAGADSRPCARALVVEGAIQSQQGIGDARRLVQQMQQFVTRRRQALEDRVAEDLAQLGGVGLSPLIQMAQIDVVGLGQTQQQLGRDGALVAFDVIEIAGRNRQIGGHGRLGEAQVPPQPLEAGAQEQLAVGGGIHGRKLSQQD